MKKIFENILQPYKWLENWFVQRHTRTFFLIIVIFFAISAICNWKWKFPYFYLFFISFTLVLTISIFAEVRYSNQINKIRALTAGKEGFMKANITYLRFEQTKWIGIIALLVVAIFGAGGLLMFGALIISPTLVLCMIYFSTTVYISIVGYVQYIMLMVYVVNLSIDKQNYKNVSELVSNRLPAEIDWLQKLTSLTHFYRSIFLTVGTFYTVAFWFYCTAPDFLTTVNHWIYFVLWGIITLAIVISFPLISFIEYYQIKKIVKKVKDAYLQEVKRSLSKRTEREKSNVERTILNQLFSTSILGSSDYPIKNAFGTIYAFFIALLNIVGSIDTLIMLGDRFLG